MDSKTIGERIRRARELRGFSQGDFADLVGRDQRTISEYENGKRRISAIDLMLFARALELSVLFFYEGEITADDFDEALLNEFRQLPPDTKSDAIQIMRDLVQLVRRVTS